MGLSQTKENGMTARLSNQIDTFYDYSIRKMGLADDQINIKNIEELKISLSVIEDALIKADSFGKCRIGFSGETSIPFLAKGDSNSTFEVGITPLLLQAKLKVISRLTTLGANAQENETIILKQQHDKYRNLWLLTLGTLLWMLGTLLIWFAPIFLKWTVITNHKSHIALSIISCLIFAGSIWSILDKNNTRRYFVIGSVVIAGIISVIALI